MSPHREHLLEHLPCFPRVSGDEPLVGKADLPELMFSPRERG